jgi:hypothetical protein
MLPIAGLFGAAVRLGGGARPQAVNPSVSEITSAPARSRTTHLDTRITFAPSIRPECSPFWLEILAATAKNADTQRMRLPSGLIETSPGSWPFPRPRPL